LHTRVRERVRGALVRFPTQSERTRQFQATTHSARAIQSSSGFWSKYIRTLSNTHRNDNRVKPKVWRRLASRDRDDEKASAGTC
jgi:hypothetical protein